MSKFYLAHGELHKLDTFNLQGIEAYKNAMYIREDVRLYNTKPLFLEQHIQRIATTLETFSIPTPTNFDIEHIQRYITRLLNVNKVYKGGICSIYILPHHTPLTWYCALFIEPTAHTEFTFNTDGWCMHIADNCIRTKPHTPCECSWHMAWLFNAHQQNTYQDSDSIGFINEQGHIVGSTQGDIIACNDKNIHIVSLNASPLSNKIASILKKHNYSITFHESMPIQAIVRSDEICIAHPIQGIRWISNIDDNVYGCIQLKKIWHTVVKHIHE